MLSVNCKQVGWPGKKLLIKLVKNDSFTTGGLKAKQGLENLLNASSNAILIQHLQVHTHTHTQYIFDSNNKS
jgi:hypothetical protein